MRTDEDGDSENFRHVGQGLDGMKQCPEKGGGHGLISANEGIRLAVLDHQGAEIMRSCDDFRGISELPRPITIHVFDTLAEQLEVRGGRRIDDVDEGERHSMFGGEGADAVAITEQDGGDDLFFDESGGGPDDPNILAFGENYTFWMPTELIQEAEDDAIDGRRFCGEIGHGGTGACTVGGV